MVKDVDVWRGSDGNRVQHFNQLFFATEQHSPVLSFLVKIICGVSACALLSGIPLHTLDIYQNTSTCVHYTVLSATLWERIMLIITNVGFIISIAWFFASCIIIWVQNRKKTYRNEHVRLLFQKTSISALGCIGILSLHLVILGVRQVIHHQNIMLNRHFLAIFCKRCIAALLQFNSSRAGPVTQSPQTYHTNV